MRTADACHSAGRFSTRNRFASRSSASYARNRRWGVCGATASLMLVTLLLAARLQRLISEPIVGLARVAREVPGHTDRLDAVVQSGTNMSLTQVSERLEPATAI